MNAPAPMTPARAAQLLSFVDFAHEDGSAKVLAAMLGEALAERNRIARVAADLADARARDAVLIDAVKEWRYDDAAPNDQLIEAFDEWVGG